MAQESTYDNEYSILLKGYDVTLTPNMEMTGYYTVTLKENAVEVFKQDLPNLTQDNGEVEEETLQNIAQAAIDMFEADRGTLGQGAGAMSNKARKAMKKTYMKRKQAYGYSCGQHEEFIMSLKGTPYEEQAYQLVSQYIDAEYSGERDSSTVDELYNKLNELEYQLKKLDLERMKMQPVKTQIIVVQADKKAQVSLQEGALIEQSDHPEYGTWVLEGQAAGVPGMWEVRGDSGSKVVSEDELNRFWKDATASKKAFLYSADCIQDYLDRFAGCPLESQAVKLIKQYIELKEELNQATEVADDRWDTMWDIESQMEALQLESVYSNVVEKIPTEGLEAFPQMAGDIAELMEGVDMQAPLIPTDPATVLARKKTAMFTYPGEAFMFSFNQFEGADQYNQNDVLKNPKIQMKLERSGNFPGIGKALDAHDTLEETPDAFDEALALAHEAGDLSPKWQDFEAYILDSKGRLLGGEDLQASKKRSFEEVEPVEDRIIELGEYTEHLQPAEVEYPENSTWNNGDRVQLKKEIEVPSWAGKKKFPSGTKGTIDELFDKACQVYLVALKDKNGKITLAKIPGKDLKKAGK